jgi:hypothetical protein
VYCIHPVQCGSCKVAVLNNIIPSWKLVRNAFKIAQPARVDITEIHSSPVSAHLGGLQNIKNESRVHCFTALTLTSKSREKIMKNLAVCELWKRMDALAFIKILTHLANTIIDILSKTLNKILYKHNRVFRCIIH